MGGNRNRRKGGASQSQPNDANAQKEEPVATPALDLSKVEVTKTTGEGRASSSVRRVQIAVCTETPDATNVDSIATPRRTPAGDGALSRHSSDMNDFQNALDELAAEKHAHIAGDTIDPERTYVERMSTPCRRPSSRNSNGSTNLDVLAAEKHAHIADDTIDPERSYVERIRSPCRVHTPGSLNASRTSSIAPQNLDDAAMDDAALDELAAEKHAHIASDTVDPERTYMERIKSPRRIDDSQTFDELVSIKHARISDDTVDPEHTYVERIKSPRRGEDNCETLYEFDHVKHAHIDADVMSPHGLVARVPTPVGETGNMASSEMSQDQVGVAAAFKGVILQTAEEKEAVRNALKSSMKCPSPRVPTPRSTSAPHTPTSLAPKAIDYADVTNNNTNNRSWSTIGYYAVVGVVGAAIVARLLAH